MTLPISIGKYRGLQQCATPGGAFAVFALDHRNNLRKALNPDNPDLVRAEQMIHFKQTVIQHLSPLASAVLLDPEIGASQCVSSQAVSGQTGLIVAVEATGYTGDATARESRILPGWGVDKAKRMGASAIKLLVYYHPDSDSAAEIEDFVHQVAASCLQYDIALFLEPLSYSLDPAVKSLASAEKRYVVIETAKKLIIPGVDVLKAEFPVNHKDETSQTVWQQACQELSQASAVPWILLSAAVSFETYLQQVTIACQAGASGVAVGRAVWKEAAELAAAERELFLSTTAPERMRRISALSDALGKPWHTFFEQPQPDDTWFQTYPGLCPSV